MKRIQNWKKNIIKNKKNKKRPNKTMEKKLDPKTYLKQFPPPPPPIDKYKLNLCDIDVIDIKIIKPTPVIVHKRIGKLKIKNSRIIKKNNIFTFKKKSKN